MKTSAQSGDLVEVHLTHKIWEGVLLETPSDLNGTLLLKLKNGYNVGFKTKDVTAIKVVKKFEKKSEDFNLALDKTKMNVAVVITGGTIAARYDAKTGGVKWLTEPANFFKFYPKLFEVCNISRIEVPFMIGSENMDFSHWKKVSRTVRELLNDKTIDGVIVTQGTDTLHYGSAAASFFLGEVNKPVVFTYSQRSIDRASSDANLNLRCAAVMATSNVAEVMTVGHATDNDDYCYAIYGTKVKKMHSSRRDAFKPINEKPIAKVYLDKIEMISDKYRTKDAKKKVSSDLEFCDKVALLKYYPTQEPDILDYYLSKGYKGIVIEMTGLGHVATSEAKNSWIKKIKEVQEKGMVLCAASQTIYGALNPLVYSAGRELADSGIIFLKDMLSETAWIKLSWVLGHEEWAKNKEIIKEKMLTNFAHEFNDRLED